MTAIGIDLGTTNSAVAVYDPERAKATVLTNSSGDRFTPSVVGLRRRGGQVLVGGTALEQAELRARETVVAVKRLMGRHYEDPSVRTAADRLAYRIVPGSDGDPRAHVLLGGQHRTPAEISGLILEKLVEDASRTLGERVTHAVITVPAYFRDAQRAATREAAERAGLVVKKIIDEPTAAAVAFGLHTRPGSTGRVLVYDLGGGTFDISILNMVRDQRGHGQFQVLSYDGDAWLGGNDFDDLIVERIIEHVREHHDVDPSTDARFLVLARKAAERAKRVLNDAPEADISIPMACVSDGVIVDVAMTLDREEFRRAITPRVETTMRLVRETLERQELTRDDISDVLLVGGGTLTREVYETVESFFGREKVRRDINPMECVALGAGILAGTLHGVECPECQRVNEESREECASCGQPLANARTVGDTDLHEVTGSDMGIAAVRGAQRDVFVPIIPRGTPYPMPRPRTESFRATDSRLIRVPVYQGTSPRASENEEQGVIEFPLPEEIEVGQRVDVSFNYSRDMIITVRVSVAGTTMVKQEELRRDVTAGARQPEADPVAEGDGDPYGLQPSELLAHTVAEAEGFVQAYARYLERSQEQKISRDIEQARRAMDSVLDGREFARLVDVLNADMFHNCGLASQLHVAELVSDGAPPDTARRLAEAVRIVRETHERGNREQLAQQVNILRNLVGKALNDRSVASAPLPDQVSHGLLEHYQGGGEV